MKKVSAWFSAIVMMSALGLSTVSCADENDPKTWAKRLDDPAQRVPAIKRLGSEGLGLACLAPPAAS